MKFLKHFNEELSPRTYYSAADKLKKLGKNQNLHIRANNLTEWGKDVAKKMRRKRWEEYIEKYSKYGIYAMSIEVNGIIIRGDFYLDISFNGDNFEESYTSEKDNGEIDIEASFDFHISLIPSNEELYNKCLNNIDNESYGTFSGFFLNLTFSTDGTSLKFKNIYLDDYDEKTLFSDRQTANKFKNLLIKIFTDRDLNYPSCYTNYEYMYDLLNVYCFIESGITAEYGVGMDDVAKYIKTVSPNTLLR